MSGARRAVGITMVALAVTGLAACGGSLTDAQVRAADGQRMATPGSSKDAASALPLPDASGSPRPAASSGAVAPGGTGAPGQQASSPAPGSTTAQAIGTPAETGPIIIASVGNYSGPAAAGVAGIPRGVQVWATMVNSTGGLFGRQIQVIVKDDGGDPATYGADVRDLVENHHVIAFVGQGATLSAQGGADYLQKHGIPIIGTDCARPDWYSYSNAFIQCPDGETVIGVMMKFGKRLVPGAKLGYIYCIEAPACTQQAPEVDREGPANGVPVVYKGQASVTTIDFTSHCQAAKKAGANLFFVAGDPNTLERVAASCDRQDYHPQFIEPSIAVKATSNQAPGLQGLALVSFTFPFHGVHGNAAIDEYTNAYARFDRQETPGPADGQGWASAKLFQRAAELAAGSTHSITSATLMAALNSMRNETLGGLTIPLTFGRVPTVPKKCAFTLRSDPAARLWTAPSGDSLTC